MMIGLPALVFSQALEKPQAIEKLDYKAYVGVNFGFAIPSGSFASVDEQDINSGYALDGQSLQLFDVGYKFYQNLNASVQYIRLRNGVDEEALARSLSAPGLRYTVEASSYELNAALLGIGFVKPTNSISLQMQIMVGYGNVFIPSFDVRQLDNAGNTTDFRFTSSRESGFGFGVSGGFRIHLTDRLDFTTHAIFINFRQDYDQLATSGGQVSIQSGQINYEVINVNFGLAFRFLPQ